MCPILSNRGGPEELNWASYKIPDTVMECITRTFFWTNRKKNNNKDWFSYQPQIEHFTNNLTPVLSKKYTKQKHGRKKNTTVSCWHEFKMYLWPTLGNFQSELWFLGKPRTDKMHLNLLGCPSNSMPCSLCTKRAAHRS